jgi:hypothetical protein
MPHQRQPELGRGRFFLSCRRRLFLGGAPRPRLFTVPSFAVPALWRKGGFQGLAARQRHPAPVSGKHRIAGRLPLRGQLGLPLGPQLRHHSGQQLILPLA